MTTRYDRRALVQSYLDANAADRNMALDDCAPAYAAALRDYYRAVLAGLEQLFGLRLAREAFSTFEQRTLFILFQSTARSYLVDRTPWSDFLEAGLLHKCLEKAGIAERINNESERIDALSSELRSAHLEILDALIAYLLGNRSDHSFTSDDLKAIGIDDRRPSMADYSDYED